MMTDMAQHPVEMHAETPDQGYAHEGGHSEGIQEEEGALGQAEYAAPCEPNEGDQQLPQTELCMGDSVAQATQIYAQQAASRAR